MSYPFECREQWPGGSTVESLRRYYRIGKGESVLDIGCGSMPFPLATHLADKYTENSPSSFGAIPKSGLPLTQCSVESMPFGDHEFDFVYCTHVLEHVDDPAAACRELMRVGKRGYIECPRSWTEHVFPAEDHRWLVDHEQNVVIFREKLPAEKNDMLGIQFALFELFQYPAFGEHWMSRNVRRVRNVEFYWESGFEFQVIPASRRNNAQNYPGFYDQSAAPTPNPDITAAFKAQLADMLARAWVAKSSRVAAGEAGAEATRAARADWVHANGAVPQTRLF